MEDTPLDQPTLDTPEPTNPASAHPVSPPPALFWQALGRQVLPKIGLFYFGLCLGLLPIVAWKPNDPSAVSGVILDLAVISLPPGMLLLVFNSLTLMINRSRTPPHDPEQHAISETLAESTPAEPRSPGAASGGCLKASGITPGILSIAVSVLTIASHPSYHGGAYALGFGLYYLFIWVPFGALPGVLAYLCAGVYSLRKTSKRGSARWLLLIGGLAFGLGFVALELYTRLS